MENKRNIKQNVLRFLEENRTMHLSGENIAESIGVSRNAVWKAISALRDDGYEIEAIRNKGYKLSAETDILSKQGIEKYLSDTADFLQFFNIEVFSEVDSTNKVLKERASEGADEGLTIVASAQKLGRGRLGRSFFSPDGSGIYLSLLLRPSMLSAAESTRITTMAAVAVCEAIEGVMNKFAAEGTTEHKNFGSERSTSTNNVPLIKWVNDIFINNKKVCGILTEASVGLENSALEYIVLGVGINIYLPNGGFPEEIKDIAGAIFEKRLSDAKNMLTAAFLKSFLSYYRILTDDASGAKIPAYIEKYKERSLAIGKRVRVISGTNSREAIVTGIDDELRLLVSYDDGSSEALSSGEISIKIF